jgi:hypothetical protein
MVSRHRYFNVVRLLPVLYRFNIKPQTGSLLTVTPGLFTAYAVIKVLLRRNNKSLSIHSTSHVSKLRCLVTP